MRIKLQLIVGVVLLGISMPAFAQEQSAAESKPKPKTTAKTEKKQATVTAVYGISADDYLPPKEIARKNLRPQVRAPRSRPAFDLPDIFYFVGGPVFLALFLRVLVIFLNGFEEKRKEELRTAAGDQPDQETPI